MIIFIMIIISLEYYNHSIFQVMVFLIDHVLPASYFANNLRALSVDMAVFRDLLRMKLPDLSQHLDYLQAAARDATTGQSPPLLAITCTT